MSSSYNATGRRRTSIAQVSMQNGSGKITVNGKNFEDYFPTITLQNDLLQPLQTAERVQQYDFNIRTRGGGINGQIGAIQLGIARALVSAEPDLRGDLKKAGHLRRDPRMKERKKPGQPGARKRFQFSKR